MGALEALNGTLLFGLTTAYHHHPLILLAPQDPTCSRTIMSGTFYTTTASYGLGEGVADW
jgi:hypothetical protein